jgi:hypothetical protein
MPEAIPISGRPTQNPVAVGASPHFDTMLKVISPDRVISAEKADRERRDAERAQQEPVLQDLARYVRQRWVAAYQAKLSTADSVLGSVDDRLLRCLRQRMGIYDPDILVEINRQGRSDIYMPITGVKCRALQDWVEDIMLPPDEPIFEIDPTPIPELPEVEEVEIVKEVENEATQMMLARGIEQVTEGQIRDRLLEMREKVQREKYENAKVAARFQGRKIEDEFKEGGFYSALKDFINDLSIFPAAFLKGPIIRKDRRLAWVQDPGGQWIPKIMPRYVRQYKRISPFNAYPGPSAKHIQDSYFCERHRGLRREDFEALLGVPGFDDQAIRGVLAEYGTRGLKEWVSSDTETEIAYSRDDDNDPDAGIDAIEFWGSVPGELLREWGMSNKKIPDPRMSYAVTVWLIGNWVICARLNPHPLGRRPYYSASFAHVPDSIWGSSPPELMRADARMCNAAARAIADNMGIASGPMVGYNLDRIEPGEDLESIYPWKATRTRSDPTGAPGDPIQFYQPNPITDALQKVFEFFKHQAAESTGIPEYIHGSGKSADTGGTATEFSMRMNNAGKTIKGVVREIDEHVVKPAVKDHWVHIMLYDDDEYKCGDVNIVARASEHLIVAEQLQLRRLEFLREVRGDQDVKNIMGIKGLATLLREIARITKIPVDDLVPPKDAIEAAVNQPPPPTPPVVPEASRGRVQAIPMPQRGVGPDGGVPGEQVRRAA